MKVLLINKYHYRKGGAETFYFTLAEILKKAGHDVIFFSMNHKKNEECKQKEYFVTNKEYNEKTSLFTKIKAFFTLVYSKETYKKLSKLIQDEKPDVAVLNNIHRQLTTAVIDALYDNKVKIYWVVHDLIMLCPNYQMLDNGGFCLLTTTLYPLFVFYLLCLFSEINLYHTCFFFSVSPPAADNSTSHVSNDFNVPLASFSMPPLFFSVCLG